jgi:PAS domain S-box-containing protein
MKKKILVIDDNRVMLTFMTNLLKKEGHEVVTAEDGISALDIISSFIPDIIFIDFVLPTINGDKLCRIFRSMQHLNDCRLVILSGALAEIEVDHAEIGADTCIAKGPFGLMTKHILATIRGDDSTRMGPDSKKILGLENVLPRQMTKELFLRIDHLEAMLESIAEGVLEISSERIVYANSAALVMFGSTLEKVLNSNPLNLFDDKTRGRITGILKSITDAPMEIGIRKPLTVGNKLVTIKIVPIQKSQSNIIMLIADVTKRRQMELELQQARKMEAIGTIASGVAHNFRNTLASILTNSQVIELSCPNDEKLLELISRINASVQRGDQLIDKLLEFSYQQIKKEFQLIDLVLLIQETMQLIQESFDQRIKIHINVTDSLPVLGDQSGLSSVLMNLYNNARDAMPEGGTLSIEARQEGDSAVVIVADTGSGMDEETIEKSFDPFFTTKEIGKGTGLGLSATYGIIESHKGTIRVKSRPNKGTEFKLLFPLAMTP